MTAQVAGICNRPNNRQCWSPGFDINTNYMKKTPNGQVRKYWWTIEQAYNWKGPDGVVKPSVLLINGKFPGPTLRGNWGDTFQVTVVNKLPNQGTGIHWHGFRMLENNINDGVPGVTECPIKPGASSTYTFRAEQYGTSWYHSHYSSQYGNGVWGSVVVYGPASANYDINLGAYPISDYYYQTVEQLYQVAAKGPPPPSDNVMFNGKNINPGGSGGAYSVITLTPGKKHLLRLINPSVEHNFQLSINGHSMKVIATDFTPVKPKKVQNLFLGIGQRADVIIEADQKVDNYWMNVTLPAANRCGRSRNPFPAAIVRYKGAPKKTPTVRGASPPNLGCQDLINYAPVVSKNVPLDKFKANKDSELPMDFVVSATTHNILWRIDNTSLVVDWKKPIVDYVLAGQTQFPPALNIVRVPQKDAWTYWIINNNNLLDHPIHLHGHDFFVLGVSGKNAGPFVYARDKGSLKTQNPTRRDVTMAPANGWLVLAFFTDNPGAWLMHCHIAWHIEGGMGINFLEQANAQKALISASEQSQYKQQCQQWIAYAQATGLQQPGSGLRDGQQ
ncbi:laccase [Microdochium trichocladiopsis]|uniref:laccase n=1 Tax=Microdochium trichocladiopsis TaxID=1682393 RepID=A0A9P8YL09_9PEZI|nr:laccase [Microdochium trichocladiopsis]KAH7040944.1 laccase [Microdochium trichocladiopsis]